MNQFFKKITFVAVLIIAVTSVVLGQTQQQTNLPKGAKLKTIKYKNFDYAIVGYVADKKFVEGQKLVFLKTKEKSGVIPLMYVAIPYNKTVLTDTITSGMYVVKDGISYLEYSIVEQRKGSTTKGLYKISNSENSNTLTAIKADASNLKIEPADIYFYQGYYNNYPMNNIPVTLQKQSENYILTMEFNDRALETSVSPDDIKKYGFLRFDDLIKHSQNVTLNFKNGNIFIGVVEKSNDKYTAKQGEYHFSTGETYEGALGRENLIYRNGRIFVPDKGETTFTDGSTANGDWLKQYNFTDNEWKQIYDNSKSLTEIRDNAIRVNDEKQIKLREEKIAQERAEQEKRIKEQQRKQEYISKYGEYFGMLISKGELDTGMSQAMVNEVWNKDFFVISKSIRSGKTVEIWEFSKDKMQMAILNEGAKNKDSGGGEAALTAIFLMGLSEQLGGPKAPQMIIFTNNKLTDIYR